MKVALFTHVCYPFTNGVATSVEQLAKQLKLRGHDVTIVSNNYDSFSNAIVGDNIRVTSFPIFYQNLRIPLLVNPELFKYLSESKIDVVHSHSDFGLAILAREYAKLHNLLMIQTYHCNYLEYARENFGELSYYICKEPVRLYTMALCRTADKVIVPSRGTKKLIEDDFRIYIPTKVIPNGIDLDKFKIDANKTNELKEQLGIAEDDFVLLSVSRLSKEKRIDEIIKLLPYLENCKKIKLLIVGGGPDERALKKLVSDLNLNNVIFTGEVPFSRIQEYYQLGDIFITNSVAETQALTTVEALASSIPCLCPNVPVYQELISNDRNGFLYYDKEELLILIKLCYLNREILMPMKKQARKSINRFSIDSSVSQIEEIYYEEQAKKKR